ncbi:MAG: CDP-glucose 4,6-dehydratase [Spirochaetales bacterium]|jgi:CDP-glucose 4,6-dehydratase|nr:CDP-glucose 4,6-dehydratase [Spirochaetales bacterium]
MVAEKFWRGKRVFITGHTGFKGSWLCLWLNSLGANVSGYALAPPTDPSLYDLAKVDGLVDSTIGDVRDAESLQLALLSADPQIIIHMAAQPLVRESYRTPVETYAVNVMGTVHLLDAIRKCSSVKAVVNVTTDKCYENREWHWGYRENEAMGGYDPYSSSKGCSELVTAAYRKSFFNPEEYANHGVAIASARAGNVIGGGDWAEDRLICDCVRALLQGEQIQIRNPNAIRPWQHVLGPLSGYLLLAQKLYEEGVSFAQSWNFGPNDSDAKPVEWIVQRLCADWGEGASFKVDQGEHPHEAGWLKLDCSKAKVELGWQPRWSLDIAIEKIVEWTCCYRTGGNVTDICLQQINAYQALEITT